MKSAEFQGFTVYSLFGHFDQLFEDLIHHILYKYTHFFTVPLTQSKHPGRNEPEEEDDAQQCTCRVFVHQYLEDEAEGKIDVVQWTNAPVGGAQQYFAVQQDGSVH